MLKQTDQENDDDKEKKAKEEAPITSPDAAKFIEKLKYYFLMNKHTENFHDAANLQRYLDYLSEKNQNNKWLSQTILSN